jgi:SAM-dependent methyltransferase
MSLDTGRPPLRVFSDVLVGAAEGGTPSIELIDHAGRTVDRLDPMRWMAGLRAGDTGLLRRCDGPTLDVGCGPGRLAATLARHGRVALGVDICPEAVRQARRRGAPTWHGNVFDIVPMEGTWNSALLADGNIGIGGDPRRLLNRCGRLLRPGGAVLVELAPPGARTWAGPVRMRVGRQLSHPFPWAAVAATDVGELCERAGLRFRTLWTEAGRWFARLNR